MYFSDIQISNYKSYHNSTQLQLMTGINIVVGKNNVGKTALLDILSLQFQANPHRSIETTPNPSIVPSPASCVTFTFTITRRELIDSLIKVQGITEFYLGLPSLESSIAQQLEYRQHSEESVEKFGTWFFSNDIFKFRLKREAFGNHPGENWYTLDESYVVPHVKTSRQANSGDYGKFRIDPITRTFTYLGYIPVGGAPSDFTSRLGSALKQYIYRFRAERFPSSPCQVGVDRVLAPDASNLAAVLNLLHGNLALFKEYNRLVREILPEIYQVGTRHLNDSLVEVVVWNDGRAISNDDLAFNLNECGSGVGQVLAILYVVLIAREPQIIIIDEPQGFLHPGAVRKLVEVLRYYTRDKHQLIVATHSPTVITSADPASVTLIKQVGAESVFESIDIKKAAEQRTYLNAVGARLSDVFGYDRVLWVEGETEEICFPWILRELTEEQFMGTAILRVQQTGDFNRKDTTAVIGIYERLSQLEGGLVPPVVGFIFDRETRSEREIEDLKRQSRGKIHFTARRMFENYLINPGGITAVLNSIEPSSIAEPQVINWLEENKENPKYYKHVEFNRNAPWTENVNGSLLLADLFNGLSDGKVWFDKNCSFAYAHQMDVGELA